MADYGPEFDIHTAATQAAALANANLARAVRETEASKERLRALAAPAIELVVVPDFDIESQASSTLDKTE